MVYTCPKCCKAFAHSSSLSRHRKTCGVGVLSHPCPFCSITFGRADHLKRHADHRCKGKPGNKRPAEQCLPENPKRPLVDYDESSSDEEEPTRATADHESSSDETEPSRTDENSLHIEEVPLHVADEGVLRVESEEEEGEEEPEDEEPEAYRDSALSLEQIKEALPWAKYQGMPEEQFAEAAQQIGGNPLFHFEFSPVSSKQWLKRVQKTVYSTRLRQMRLPKDSDDVGVAIVKAMEGSTRQHLEKIGAREEDRVFLAITAHDFNHIYQTTEFTVREFMAGSTRLDQLFRKLAGKLNSNESFHPDQGFQLDLTLVRPLGRGSGHEKGFNPGRMGRKMSRQMKHSIVEIKNGDELCCARAIVTMKARADWKVIEKKVQEEESREVPDKVLLEKLKAEEKELLMDYNTLRCTPKEKKPTLQLQRTLAYRLHRMAVVPEGPCGPDELKTFQTYLATLDPPYQLKVFCDIVQKPVYTGPQKADEDHILVLLKSENHYDCCTSLTGFLNRSYYCHDCDRAFNTNDPAHHSCLGQNCQACGGNPCPNRFGKRTTLCEDCHGLFFGPDCFRVHRTNGKCDKYHTCTNCFAEYRTDKEHQCGQAKCHSCKELVDLAEHRCHIQPIEEDELEPPLFVYADIEAMTMPDRTFRPNLLCYQTSAEETIHSLWGEDCCLQFIQKLDKLAWIRVGKKKMKERPVIVLFHNLKGFDGVFILNTLYKDGRSVESQFYMGAKVLCFTSGPLTFKDSLCFLPFPLSAFPATFGINELKKGYFPHGFNTPDNQSYVGPIPAMHHYDPDGMKEKDKKEFEKWYAEQRGVVYNFKTELKEYCESDVALLKAGCEAFVEQFSKEAEFNPFAKCSTIASACNLYWRRSIEEDTPAARIAVRPLRGWHGATINQSQAALQWLWYRESLLPKEGAAADRIRHAKNGGEKSLWTENGFEYVDGWDAETETVYEFHGCLWHGCPTCYPSKRDVKRSVMPDRTPNEAYRATLEKTRRLCEAGYVVVERWECEWTAMVQNDPSVKAFVNQLESVEPLEPRDAFFGGRTGAVALYHQVDPGEEIHYMDVTSLYPWVNKTQEYPLGHPTIRTQVTPEEFPRYFGLAKVTILPPPELYHPVLPMRSGGKLTFPLCTACVQEEQARPMLERSPICRHSPAERVLHGTWCTPEINKAMEMGYELVRVHEVWHFKERKSGLFAEYVNTWLKIKTEASGWPKDCTTEEKKRDYIKRFKKKEGIRLEYEKVEKNPGLKATAKLMLNSFWGKFGQRENLPQVEQCTSPNQLYDILEDDTKHVSDIRFCTEEVVEAVYTHKEEAIFPSNKTNVFVAAFTTCWARLKLYSYLERLGEQVLYYDTDSVIYKWRDGQCKIETGDYLGDMKDELEGSGHIVEFVSGGAKNYGYTTSESKVECKVRGFTLNVRGMAVLNYSSMKSTILSELEDGEEETLQVTNPSHFKRNTTTKEIGLVEQTKHYRLVFDKRVVDLPSKQSYPFGYFQS